MNFFRTTDTTDTTDTTIWKPGLKGKQNEISWIVSQIFCYASCDHAIGLGLIVVTFLIFYMAGFPLSFQADYIE